MNFLIADPPRGTVDGAITRRRFLKTSAGLGLIAAAGGSPLLSFFAEGAPLQGGATALLGQWVSSTCQGCTSWCPV